MIYADLEPGQYIYVNGIVHKVIDIEVDRSVLCAGTVYITVAEAGVDNAPQHTQVAYAYDEVNIPATIPHPSIELNILVYMSISDIVQKHRYTYNPDMVRKACTHPADIEKFEKCKTCGGLREISSCFTKSTTPCETCFWSVY